MKSKLIFFFAVLFISVWSLSGNAQSTIPKGKAQLIEFTNSTAKFTVPDGKTWFINNVFSDYEGNPMVSKYDNKIAGCSISIFFKSINGVSKTDISKNLYGAKLYSTSGLSLEMPIVLPEKTIIELIIIYNDFNEDAKKVFNGSGYMSIIETDN